MAKWPLKYERSSSGSLQQGVWLGPLTQAGFEVMTPEYFDRTMALKRSDISA